MLGLRKLYRMVINHMEQRIKPQLHIHDSHSGYIAGPRSAVGNVSGYRCVSDCRSRGRQFDPGPVPYFHGD